MEPTKQVDILRMQEGEIGRTRDVLVREQRVTVSLEDRVIVQTVCGPGSIRELVYGHLVTEGWISSAEDVEAVADDRESPDIVVRLRKTCGTPSRSLEPVASRYAVRPGDVLAAAQRGEEEGRLFRVTGGTHVAAVLCVDGSHAAAEDISRTCALEKAVGKAFLASMDMGQSILFLTSRVPRLFVEKAGRAGIPIIAAVSAPTYEAVEMAERLGICLCGFVRGSRLNVYSRPLRLGL